MSDVNVPGGGLGESPRGIHSQQLWCEKCGLIYFVEAQFRQYRKMSSSMPGGDLMPHTENPIPMLVCMCGNLVPPGKLRNLSISREQDDNFQKSLAAARQYREGAHPEAMISRLSQSYASREAHDRLAERIASLEGILRALLLKSVTPPPDSPGAKR